MKIVVGLFLCTALLATAQDRDNELALRNSGFETGVKTPDGWTVTGGSPDLKVSWGFETNHPYSGDRSLQVQADGYAGSVLISGEKIPLETGYYVARWWAKVDEDSGEGQYNGLATMSKSTFPNDRKILAVGEWKGVSADGQWHRCESRIFQFHTFDELQLGFQYRFGGKGSLRISIDDVEIVKTNMNCYRYQEAEKKPLPPIEPVHQALSARAPSHTEVSSQNGRARIRINGQATPPTYYTTFAKYEALTDKPSPLVPPITDFKNAGVRIYNPMIKLQSVWVGKNTFDFSTIEKTLMNVLRMDPDGYLIVRLAIAPYPKWGEENPDDVTCDESGKKIIVADTHPVGMGRALNPHARNEEGYAPSYYSEKARVETAEALRTVIEHIQSLPAGKAVIGYNVNGGNDYTYRPYSVGMPTLMDYSPAALAAFRTYLKEIYQGDVERLRKAWAVPEVTFETAAIPSEARRLKETFFLLSATDRDVVDFEAFLAGGVTETILSNAKAVKSASKNGVIVGTYGNEADSLAFGRLLKSGNLDFYHCYSADGRSLNHVPGAIPVQVAALSSIELHQKIFFVEQDFRTWLSQTNPRDFGIAGWAETAEDYIAMTKRENGMMLSLGHGGYWFDMNPGGWFRDDELMAGIAEIQRAHMADLPCVEKPYAEVALFFDEQSSFYISPKYRRNWLFDIFATLQEFNGSGVPYHFYLQEDLANPNIPDYKAYIFLNAHHLSAAERQIIDKLKAAGKTICFLHASNIIGAKSPAEGISEITGIQVAPDGKRLLMVVPSGKIDSTFGKYGKITSISGNTFTGEGFTVTDTNAVIIGEYPDGKAAAAWIQSGKSKILFCGSPELKAGFINRLARWAGAWVAAEPGDAVFVNRRWLTIHAVTDGEKTITLATPSRVVDFTTGKEIAKKTQTVVVSMKRGETRWFALTPKSGSTSLPTNP